MSVTFARERFHDVIDELKPLLERHWREIALYQDEVVFDPDYDRYADLDEKGVMHAFFARVDGNIVGYAVYFVMPHLHYRRDKWAVCDIVWIAPEHRRQATGAGLFSFVEESLRASGATAMHTNGKEDHPALGFLLEHLGHGRVQFGYSKLLKEA
jgi:GNAT superfamily N-acetyltransferase